MRVANGLNPVPASAAFMPGVLQAGILFEGVFGGGVPHDETPIGTAPGVRGFFEAQGLGGGDTKADLFGVLIPNLGRPFKPARFLWASSAARYKMMRISACRRSALAADALHFRMDSSASFL